jgi:hypothetical protein
MAPNLTRMTVMSPPIVTTEAGCDGDMVNLLPLE